MPASVSPPRTSTCAGAASPTRSVVPPTRSSVPGGDDAALDAHGARERAVRRAVVDDGDAAGRGAQLDVEARHGRIGEAERRAVGGADADDVAGGARAGVRPLDDLDDERADRHVAGAIAQRRVHRRSSLGSASGASPPCTCTTHASRACLTHLFYQCPAQRTPSAAADVGARRAARDHAGLAAARWSHYVAACVPSSSRRSRRSSPRLPLAATTSPHLPGPTPAASMPVPAATASCRCSRNRGRSTPASRSTCACA